VARRTTSKTGSSKQEAAPRRSKTTKTAAEPKASEQAKTTAPDTPPAPTNGDLTGPVDTKDTPETVPLADGPGQMGEDTAAAPDQPAPATEDAMPAPEDAAEKAAESAEQPAAPDMVDPAATAPDAAEQPAQSDTAETGPGAPDAPEPAQTDSAPETPPTDTKPAASTPAPAAAPEKRGGFFPMLLGGLVAGGIGYGAHLYQTSQQAAPTDALDALSAELSELRAAMAQEADLTALEAQIAALEPAQMPDASAIEASIEELRTQIAAIPAPVDISGLQAQIDDLTAQDPVDLGPIRDSLAALEAAYAPVPEQIAALQADMEDLRALATQEVVEAEAAVDAALASAGLDRIRAAFVTGAAYADAVEQLAQAGVAVPDALQDTAASGVPTVEGLQEGFDPAARAAVSASLQSAPAESATEKLGNFFRAQIGARSLAPREGDDPDAIVARAGVAVSEGDLAQARDELASLPEAGRAAMSDWLAAVETRLNAAAATDAVQAEITAD